jgi:hypothetical protein
MRKPAGLFEFLQLGRGFGFGTGASGEAPGQKRAVVAREDELPIAATLAKGGVEMIVPLAHTPEPDARSHDSDDLPVIVARITAVAVVVALAATPVVLARQTPPAPVTNAAGVTITIDHNTAAKATRDFKFARVPSPAKDDAAAKATLQFVDGDLDPNGAGLSALIDGLLPRDEDEPGGNLFFNAGTAGGAVRIDLGRVVDVLQINTYSWHPNTRGPQLYSIYGSDGTSASFNLAPKGAVDPATAGWTLIASVDTRTGRGDDGGQYGVSLTRAGGSLGSYRYLLFVCHATEFDDDWGNTFYSELDVIAAAAR